MRLTKTLVGLLAVLLPYTAGAAHARPAHRRTHRAAPWAPLRVAPAAALTLTLQPPPAPTADAKTEADLKRVLYLGIPENFLELHAKSVHDSLLEFDPAMIGVTPLLRAGLLDAERPASLFVPPARTDDFLSQARQRNVLQLGAGPSDTAAFSLTVVSFFAVTLMSVESTRRYRKLFYGPVHIAPATFDGGAMGLGFGGPLP